MQKKEIINRIIPLPRNIKVSKGVVYETSRVKVVIKGEITPPLKTASEILGHFASPGQLCPDFMINLRLIDKDNDKSEYKKLSKVRNCDQSYSIKSKVEKGVYKSIEIRAFTDIGLLYGAVTLSQAIVINPEGVYFPVLDIRDWPEIAFRGQWGGNSNCDLHWTFQYKLNAIDGKVSVTADENQKTVVVHNDRLYHEAAAYGVDVMATIPHLEQISRLGFLDNRTDILNVPSEERRKRSDYFPGLCMSKKATGDLILEWFRGIAANRNVKKILVWLSEESTPCLCDDCRGKEPFQLETACLLDAYSRLKKEYPGIGLGIMLSQGSFEVTEQIAGMIPNDVSLTYYDGGRTYDSGRYPMILPVLEKFSASGGKLGVYPQVTHSWRTVFPWTAPGFIKYRCGEFHSKGLHRVIGYAVPSNRYHEFNLMAFAEWLWNPDGRSKEDFIGAYAFLNGIPEKPFQKFLRLIEEPAWQLAQSKLMLRLTYNYPLILRGRVELEDHRYEMSELIPIKKPEKLIADAQKALSAADATGEKSLVCEARCVIAGLRAYISITGFIEEIEKTSINTEKLLSFHGGLREAAADMRISILKWNRLMTMDGAIPMGRVVDTSMVLYRALDGFGRYFKDTGVQLEEFSGTVTHLGEWDESSFDKDGNGVLEFDVTEYINRLGKGRYYISLDFIESESGTDVSRITLVEKQPAGGEKPFACVNADIKRVSVWAPWAEYPLEVRKPVGLCRYILRMDVSGLEKGRGTCRGLAGIRKV
ncbi:MAG: hypothetical protein JXB33_02850 [Clostridia bacterium]|nr:hypothetical protein [Clostridia bacterium]